MSNKDTGGPAFPARHQPTTEVGIWETEGMTLRDYFAAKTMQSLVIGETWPSCSDMQLAADLAYKMADAMLEARKS